MTGQKNGPLFFVQRKVIYQEANDQLRAKLNQVELTFLVNKNAIKQGIRKNNQRIDEIKAEHLESKSGLLNTLVNQEE